MVSLNGLKKRVYEYFTFPDGTEPEHLVISRVIVEMDRKISKAKKPKSITTTSSSPTSSTFPGKIRRGGN
ncbi:hypothetical protein RirG_189450 [Rhizophagus irregularis DAOM 197198w]|uniref:Uncharacterized protein n=1 Tax=Rhizophagus irregularis (strain DAOM 197198w) TaxID=1432141 RepID=A0A015JWB3_RHIIW|nr:hypothetical protein RirG_189450 [Rhizophagus irregularis DAOM 197198w]